MLVNILIFIVAGVFSAYVIGSVCRKYIGRNPQAPSLWARIKAWWTGFVKRHIVDDDPYQSELHAMTRYEATYSQSCPHCGANPYIMECGRQIAPRTYEAICANCKRPK